jgi:hypothetical protein
LAFWQANLNTRRFRAAFDSKLASAGLGLRLLTHDHNLPALHLGSVMRRRLKRGFARRANGANPYIQRLFGRELAPANSFDAFPFRILRMPPLPLSVFS